MRYVVVFDEAYDQFNVDVAYPFEYDGPEESVADAVRAMLEEDFAVYYNPGRVGCWHETKNFSYNALRSVVSMDFSTYLHHIVGVPKIFTVDEWFEGAKQ